MSKKALLVISFGTTYSETRDKTIGAIEKHLANRFKNYDLHRAFTSRMVIGKLKERDSISVDTPTEALIKLRQLGYDEVICQTTHVLSGYEYDKTIAEIADYKDKFTRITVGKPLLSAPSDYQTAVKAIVNNTPSLTNSEVLFLMGHGTEHPANDSYTKLSKAFRSQDINNIYVGTVEGHPEIEDLLSEIENKKIKKVYLMPFMIVAGDHAQNDMAGDEDDSWKTILENKGYETEVILKGLGELPEIRTVFEQHILDILPSARTV